MAAKPINISVYRFAGKFGPFKVKIPCGECTLTGDIIKDTLDTELAGISVELVTKDWLSFWWEPLIKGGWHAPIVLVEGKVISQGVALNRAKLIEAIATHHAKRSKLAGNHLYGKAGCPYCTRAKAYLDKKNIPFNYHDIVKNPRDLYDMLSRLKPIIGEKTPVTAPQIWLDGEYIGGAEALEKK